MQLNFQNIISLNLSGEFEKTELFVFQTDYLTKLEEVLLNLKLNLIFQICVMICKTK